MGGYVDGSSMAVRTERSSWGTGIGILLIALGILAIIFSFVAGVTITVIVGWVLLFAGIARLLYAWSFRGAGAVIWQLIVGVLYLWVAFYLIFHPGRGLLTLTFFLAAYFVIEGIFELVSYFQLRRRSHQASWFLWDGLITLILGIIIWAQWPFSSAWALGVLVGVSLISSGVARLSFRHGPSPLLGPA